MYKGYIHCKFLVLVESKQVKGWLLLKSNKVGTIILCNCQELSFMGILFCITHLLC